MARNTVEEDVFEDLEELEEEGEELEDLDDDDEELEDDDELEDEEEEEEEEEPQPRRKRTAKAATRKLSAAKKSAAVDMDNPAEVIERVMVKGLLAFIQQEVSRQVAAQAGEDEPEEAPAPRRRRKVAQKATAAKKPVARRQAAPARKGAGKASSATLAEVRSWLQENDYDVADRGRISEPLKKVFVKKTGRRIAV